MHLFAFEWSNGLLVSAAALLLIACTSTSASGSGASLPSASGGTARIVTEEFHISSADAGIQLYLRNKHPEGTNSFRSEKILLFVHGATYPAETTFDLPLGGISWMTYIAQHGWDVWLVDLRGYGASSRPPEMDEPPEKHPPIVGTDVAIRDVGTAVDFIRNRRGVPRLNVMGWSWGTTIMGTFTARNPDKVARLVLYAPQWVRTGAPPLIKGEGAYRTVLVESTRARWLTGVPEDKKKDLIPAGWFETWAAATFATDPVGSKQSPPVLRAPNGVLKDGRDYWSAGKPYYDPAMIAVPTLIVHAEWDADLPSYMAQAVFSKLTRAPLKRFVEIGEGTHTVIMEKNRMQLFREVQLFLDEPLAEQNPALAAEAAR
jgi:pimeloyl-ACP methyl ester carboxylesterase